MVVVASFDKATAWGMTGTEIADASAGQAPGGKVALGDRAASGSKVGRMYI